MKAMNCDIIKDILPLYVDDVVSDATKEMVEEHIAHCDGCKQEMESMKAELVIPIEQGKDATQPFKKLKRKWRNKKIIIVSISVLLTALVMLGTFSLIFHEGTFVPYDDSLIKIEEQDHILVAHYYGGSYHSISATHPIAVHADGIEKNIVFLYYTQTIVADRIKALVNGDEARHEQEYIFPLDSRSKIDAVCYVDFDISEITSGKTTWEGLLRNGVIIWGK